MTPNQSISRYVDCYRAKNELAKWVTRVLTSNTHFVGLQLDLGHSPRAIFFLLYQYYHLDSRIINAKIAQTVSVAA